MLEVISDMCPVLPWKLHFFALENPFSYQGNQSFKKKSIMFITEVEVQVLMGLKEGHIKQWGDESRHSSNALIAYLWWETSGGQSLRRTQSERQHQLMSLGMVRHLMFFTRARKQFTPTCWSQEELLRCFTHQSDQGHCGLRGHRTVYG